MIDREARIGETAVIGADTKVWQFASVIRGARVGERCVIGGCAVVDGAFVGSGCKIGHGAQLHPGSWLGNDVFVGPGAILCNDRWPGVDRDGFEIEPLLSGEVVTVDVKDGASIGAGAIILPGVVIGEGAMIAAGAVVDRSVPMEHLFKRSGEIVPIDPARTPKRMREAA